MSKAVVIPCSSLPSCACGCGQAVSGGSRYVRYHHLRGRKWSEATIRKRARGIRKSHALWSVEEKARINKAISETNKKTWNERDPASKAEQIRKNRLSARQPERIEKSKRRLLHVRLNMTKEQEDRRRSKIAHFNRTRKIYHPHFESTKAKLREAVKQQYARGDCWKTRVFHSRRTGRDIDCQGSYEIRAVELLECDNCVVDFDRCNTVIHYTYKGECHVYFPDLFVKYSDGSRAIIEVKPELFVNAPINKVKFEAARALCKVKGWAFLVWSEKQLNLETGGKK